MSYTKYVNYGLNKCYLNMLAINFDTRITLSLTNNLFLKILSMYFLKRQNGSPLVI